MVPTEWFVDVQDSARLHIAALVLPDVANERIFAVQRPFTINQILVTLRKLYPKRHFGNDVEAHGEDLNVYAEQDRALHLLKRMGREGWTDMETSIKWQADSFIGS